ncbi:MAG: NADH-quinone oxidoreductase subunit D [Candidatus Marinimicrobia bacterium]|nr:NADH-quinone oxidoreductase subunit D [Candidatus Neomarinimicrobiota bacterium]
MRDLHTEEMTINMGPQHPSTHGVLRLRLRTDGEVVTGIEPVLGYLHRCFEKHSENLEYPGVIPFVDRCDYLAAMNNDHGYAMAIEKLLGIEVPERVEYLRIIFAELQRIASHLVAFGTFGLDTGAFTPFLYAFREREMILDLFEMTCGARLLYNYIWVGGLSHDIQPGFVEKTYAFLDHFEPKIKEYNNLLTHNKIFIERTADVGVLPAEVAINYGVTGPQLRASGVDWDLRRDEPYSIYDRFDWDVIIGSDDVGALGDCWNRYYVKILEMQESAKIIRQALNDLPVDGDVQEAIPRKIRPPKGSFYFRSENPRGELGFYIISDGSTKPFRVKMRSPALCNLSVIDEIGSGWLVADIVAILGSLDIVLGEIDR